MKKEMKLTNNQINKKIKDWLLNALGGLVIFLWFMFLMIVGLIGEVL